MPKGNAPRLLPVSRRVALVVADVPRSDYAPAVLEPRLADADWVSAAAAAHHRVIERLARTHALVPLRLFTIFSSDARARRTIAAKAPRLNRTLQRLEGREEWVLRIGTPDPAHQRAGAQLPSQEVSGTSFLRQKAAVVQARRARAQRIRMDTARLVDALEALADVVSLRPPPDGASLLVDAAFLVDRRKRQMFRRALTAHATPLLADGCAVSLTGPWPPYSFAAIE
jgi:hypothetical protein